MARKRTSTTRKNAVRQDEKPSYGKPPTERQFKPGKSGSPKGPPRHRTNLWVYFTQYMAMTAADRAKINRTTLTAAQETALRMVERAVKGRGCGFERLARYIVDREEGKAAEHLIIGKDTDLTDAECEELRTLIRKSHDRDTDK
jgi:hypothetical protein